MKLNNVFRITAIILLVILGLGGVYGGWLLIIDSSGDKMQFPLELLDKTPFHNYLIPGIILILANGLLTLFIALMVILKMKYWNWAILLQGCILIGWLTIELLLNPDFFVPFMHYSFYIIGIILVVMGFVLINGKAKTP